ncbi:MAG: hypothetical protein EP329_06130 [Deltaproteobacteria bacterium]|nr:MAG: hypothetical protein EP329_06130 [Deltaproteobacteria bacterium]
MAQWKGRSGAAPLVLLALMLAPALVGFSSAPSFDLAADVGGGGGYTFTGSPVSHGMSCLECHQSDGRTPQAAVYVHAEPDTLFEEGYVAGQVYEITVHLTHEERGLDRNGGCTGGLAGCNRNLFVAELLDGGGTSAGVLCPDGIGFDAAGACEDQAGRRTSLLHGGAAVAGQSLVAPLDCSAAGAVPGACVDLVALQASGASQEQIAQAISEKVRGSTVWSFQWRAPDPPIGTIDLWLGAVDGDGGTTVDPRYADFAGDVAVVERFAIAPNGVSLGSSGGGCVGGGVGVGLWMLFVGLVGVRRLRRGTV